jgi:DNA repair protein SbcC/Rad50
MIFNRFFRSKHLDPNPQVRIKAIEKLNTTLSSEKTVLHELAFNDPDASVSLAALHKLDSFTLWYKMSEIGKDERVLKKSQQIVEQMLFDETNVGLNEKDKLSFIRQCNDSNS